MMFLRRRIRQHGFAVVVAQLTRERAAGRVEVPEDDGRVAVADIGGCPRRIRAGRVFDETERAEHVGLGAGVGLSGNE